VNSVTYGILDEYKAYFFAFIGNDCDLYSAEMEITVNSFELTNSNYHV